MHGVPRGQRLGGLKTHKQKHVQARGIVYYKDTEVGQRHGDFDIGAWCWLVCECVCVCVC